MEYKDEHYCVVCCHTIYGLMNYVIHRKNGCQPEKKIQITSPPYIDNDIKSPTVSNDSKTQYVTNDSKPAYIANDSNPTYVTIDSNPAYVANDGKPANVANDSKPAYVTNDSKPPNKPNNRKAPYICNDHYQEYNPLEDDSLIDNVSEASRQSESAENCLSLLTGSGTTEASESNQYLLPSVLDLSRQNDINLATYVREPCPVNSSNNVEEVDVKVDKQLITDTETDRSLADRRYVVSQQKNQIDTSTTSGTVTLPVVRDNGLLSVFVIERQDIASDAADKSRKGKKRQRPDKTSDVTDVSRKVKKRQRQGRASDVTEKSRKGKIWNQIIMRPKSKISKVKVDVAETGIPADDVVGNRTDATSGANNDGADKELLYNVIKCEQQPGETEGDDIAGVDGTGDKSVENGYNHPGDGNEGNGNQGDGNHGDGNQGNNNRGDCNHGDGNQGDGNHGDGNRGIGSHGDGADKKAMSDTEGNSSFNYKMECSKCDLKFDNRCSLLEHFLTVIKDETNENVHEDLALKFESYYSHHSPFQCCVCRFYCTRLDDFLCHLTSADHMSTAGYMQPELKCRTCNITFTGPDNLEPHFLNVAQSVSENIGHVIIAVNEKGENESLDDCSVTNENMRLSPSTDNSVVMTEPSVALDQDGDLDTDHPDNDVIEETEIKVDPDDNIEEYMGNETYDTEEKYQVDEDSLRFDTEFTELPKSRKKNGSKTSRTNETKKTLNCKHCWFTCDVAADMKFHYLDQHIELTHKCDICDIVFLTRGTYGKHIHSKEHQCNIEKLGPKQSSQEFFQCYVCKKKFTSENYCKFHTALQHFHFKSEECLLLHPSITRDKYGEYLASIANQLAKTRCKCPECGTMVSKAGMMAHLRQHTGEQPFQCKLCVQSFVNMTSLRRHLGVHFNIFAKSCETCGQQFKRLAHYNDHVLLHKAVEIDSKAHVCEVCGTSFYLAKALRNHLYKHQEKTLKCDQPGCKWSFHNKHDLTMHKLTHSSDGNAFICATCGFTAKCKKYLKAHEKIHAKDVPLLECQYCEYKARKNTHMRRHMRIHLGSKPYKCPYCNYACNTHDNIRKHILETNIHIGLKVYPCKFCDFSTNSTKDFRAHLMSDHSDLVEDGARAKSLSSFTGLFIESEDLSVPEEGMQILPVVRRKNSRRSFKSDMEISQITE